MNKKGGQSKKNLVQDNELEGESFFGIFCTAHEISSQQNQVDEMLQSRRF
jgi:hypothetical protein